MKSTILLPIVLGCSLVCSAPAQKTDFHPLFNGKDMTGWHVRKTEAHNAWRVENGELINDLKTGEHGVDLVTDKKYWNFTVRYEYKVPNGSNSGFYLRGRHEIQVLGDYKKGKPDLHGDASIYGIKAPDKYVSKPGGEWNTTEVTIVGNKITMILNGEKIHDQVECTKATGSEIDANINEPGPFFLQGDHGAVSFRNIQVKELP